VSREGILVDADDKTNHSSQVAFGASSPQPSATDPPIVLFIEV